MKPVELPHRIDGDGFVLRRLRADDAAAVTGAFRDDPALGGLLGFDEDPDEEWVSNRLGRTYELVIADPRTEAFLGMVLLHSFDDKNRHCEVAFWLIAGARRHGLGTAVVTLMISWAMCELDVRRVELTTTPENAATQALADRLGFTREGVLRQRNIERGRRVDVVWYGLLREEWLS